MNCNTWEIFNKNQNAYIIAKPSLGGDNMHMILGSVPYSYQKVITYALK
jgi:hypothetical protein